MNLLLKVSFITGVIFTFICFSSCEQPHEKENRVLVFSKTVDFRHESIKNGKEMFLKLGLQNNFEVDTTEIATVFHDDSLHKYSAIVFLSTTGDILDHAQQAAMQRYMEAGGGFLGIHGASGAEYSWPWYGDLLGARFESHPPELQTGEIYATDKDHPATEALPFPWNHKEEWYNFNSVSSEIVVLATVNESSFEGGKHGDNHPIIWYQEFNGGRSFYTALGHRPEAYSDSTFINHILGGLQYVIGGNKPLDYNNAITLSAPGEDHLRREILVDSTHVEEPMELAVAKDGRVFYIERRGKVKVYNNGTGKAKIIGTIPVYHEHEDGLLGLALDPNFLQNQWIYIFYSAPDDAFNYHISRFTLNDEGLMDIESEKILLKVHEEHSESNHTGGSLAFGPDGNLFIAIGDNTHHAGDSGGYAPIDERPGRTEFDAQRASGNTMDLRGKILRIRPVEEGSYTIPEGNLFDDSEKGRPEIYVMGTRNSFRISVDPKTSWLYWGDVGPDAGKDSIQGPQGYDEINQARKAGNYGWPFFIGDNRAYADVDFATGEIGETFKVGAPVNDSPRNTGAKVLPPAKGAFIYYPYVKTNQFPLLGEGGRTAMAGPVYHYDENLQSDVKLPEYFDQGLFIYDWMRNWVMVVRMDEQGNYSSMEPFMPSTRFEKIIDMELGPDGALYILEYGKNWYSPNSEARLSRLEFQKKRNNNAQSHDDKIVEEISDGQEPIKSSLVGKNLIAKSDCMACHAVDQKSVGPSFMEIATKYERRTDEIKKMLSTRIIEGSTGIWGPNPMIAHPQLTEEEATKMVEYILSLNRVTKANPSS